MCEMQRKMEKYLDSSNSKEDFSQEEDEQLIKFVNEIGKNGVKFPNFLWENIFQS